MSLDSYDYTVDGQPREQKYVEQFKPVQRSDESILWTERPSLPAYLAGGGSIVFQYILMFVFAYIIFGNFFGLFGFGDSSDGFGPFSFILFFWVVIALFSIGQYWAAYPNTYYAATDRRLIHRTGIMGTDYKSLPYDNIQDMQVKVNPVEMLLGKGTIRIYSGERGNKGRKVYDNLTGIHDPYTVFSNLTKFADGTTEMGSAAADSTKRSASTVTSSWTRRNSIEGGAYDSISGVLAIAGNVCFLAAFALFLWVGWSSLDAIGFFNGERSFDQPDFVLHLLGAAMNNSLFRYVIMAGVLAVFINVIRAIVESFTSLRS